MNNFINLIVEHIFIVLMSVTLATSIAIPLGIIIYKKQFYVNLIINLVSVLQAFPTLGMFAILVPLMGIGISTAIFVMFLYALLPIFLNVIQGFKSINPEYDIIITSLNIDAKKVFFKIELPLIMPFIISGIRLTTIYTISLATMATLIGAGGLGDLIYLGLQQLNIKLTVLGIIPLLVLTILTNILFNYVERKLLPADVKFKLGNKHE
ncbi:MAG: ABC transporter permease [Mycoplasmatales bacterium]